MNAILFTNINLGFNLAIHQIIEIYDNMCEALEKKEYM